MEHVNQCPSCLDQFRARQLFDTRVATTMNDVPVPLELHDRILSRLDAQSIPRRRSIRRIAQVGSLAAAAALVLMSASLYFRPRAIQSPIEIDWKELGELAILGPGDIDELRELPAGMTGLQGVQEWCSKQLIQLKLVGRLPATWTPLALAAVGRTSIERWQVAVFRFQDSRGESEIIALPHDKFRIGDLGKGTRLVMRTRNLVVIAWDEQDTSYVAVLKDWAPEDWRRLIRGSNDLI
jgi:hypothetical protein